MFSSGRTVWDVVQGRPPDEWVGLVRASGFTPDERWGATLVGCELGLALLGVVWSGWRGRSGWAWWWGVLGVTLGAATVFAYTTITLPASTPQTGYTGTVIDIGPWRWCRVGDLVQHAYTMVQTFEQAGLDHLVDQARTGYPGRSWPGWWDGVVQQRILTLDPWVLSSDRGGLLERTRADGIAAAQQWARLHPVGWTEWVAQRVGTPRQMEILAFCGRSLYRVLVELYLV